jgi:hypothetical protein
MGKLKRIGHLRDISKGGSRHIILRWILWTSHVRAWIDVSGYEPLAERYEFVKEHFTYIKAV